MLKKCLHKDDQVVTEVPSDLTPSMVVEARPLSVLDRRVRVIRRKNVSEMQVLWDCNGAEEVTWEPDAKMKRKFSKWFGKLEGYPGFHSIVSMVLELLGYFTLLYSFYVVVLVEYVALWLVYRAIRLTDSIVCLLGD
ncbi:hypothetical protein V5N11_003194 [Cardamine amara subsp. amara]|uniref:Chromo domain-containing protein n=1 Tax=Cardamine amara subsp. amara TaxID=228776 RepID=A0ABD0Z0C8_CARAN